MQFIYAGHIAEDEKEGTDVPDKKGFLQPLRLLTIQHKLANT